MAAAPVAVAPVLTPRTVIALAGEVDCAEFPEMASSLRALGPFVQAVVDKLFIPLLSPLKKTSFKARFNRLSRDYEPFRLFLSVRVFSALQGKDILGAYERVLREWLGPLLTTAEEMDMAPELVAAHSSVGTLSFLR
jgi:hypothetical protein